MAQLCQKSDTLSHLTGFWVISIVSDLLNFIIYVIAFMLLLARVHGVLFDLDNTPGSNTPGSSGATGGAFVSYESLAIHIATVSFSSVSTHFL